MSIKFVYILLHLRRSKGIQAGRAHGSTKLCVMRHRGHARHRVMVVVHVAVVVGRGGRMIVSTLGGITRGRRWRGVAGHLVVVGGRGTLHATVTTHQIRDRCYRRRTPDGAIGYVGTGSRNKLRKLIFVL